MKVKPGFNMGAIPASAFYAIDTAKNFYFKGAGGGSETSPNISKGTNSVLLMPRSYTKTTTKKKRTRGRKTSLKTKIMRLGEAKHFVGESTTNINANKIYTFSPSMGISQGTTIATRVGDSVFLEALKIKGTWGTNTASNAYVYRILVGMTGKEFTYSSSFTKDVLSGTQLFHSGTGATYPINGQINSKAVTILYDRTFDLNSQVASARSVYSYADTIPIKKRFDYQSGGSSLGKDYNLFIAVMGYAPDVTTDTSMGYNLLEFDLIFKDH